MQAIDRLKMMIGNVYNYEGGKMTVHNVEESGNFGVLKTDTGDVRISLENIDEELSFFELKSSNGLVKNPALMDVVLQSNNIYNQIQTTLLSTIEKIENDKNYIPQAQSINDTIKTLIDLEKVKVQTLQLLK